MPISRKEFEKLEQVDATFEEQVFDFLKGNRESAYTPKEIALGLDPNALLRDPSAGQVSTALVSLLTRKVVVCRWRENPTGNEYFFAIP